MAAEEIVYEEQSGTELARIEAAPPTLFGTSDPAAVIVKASETAKPLAEVIRKQKLATNIQGREHVRVEGWTLLGSMLGVFPVCVWTRKLEDGWEARVEARTRDGAVVGAAEAECLYSEKTWAKRDDYALRSMAQTRATSKALRAPLGFVMQLAGFEATPAEEMPASAQRESEFRAPDGAADPHGFNESRADNVPNDGKVRVHFGKNTGIPVEDLTPRQREWYAGDGWAKAKADKEVSETDWRLREAARRLCGLPVIEASGPFMEIPF